VESAASVAATYLGGDRSGRLSPHERFAPLPGAGPACLMGGKGAADPCIERYRQAFRWRISGRTRGQGFTMDPPQWAEGSGAPLLSLEARGN
jgi:hypothetical protein